MANHLIIGLGGTGGKVLRELRKRIYEEFRSNEPSGNVYLDYLYIDSSPKDLNDRSAWRALGKSVHLNESQKVSIHGINVSMLNNLQLYPGIDAFLDHDDVKLMTDKIGPLVTAGIGGQRRRLGRLLLANNMSINDNNNFTQRLNFAVNSLTNESGDADVTFHVCAGLAGGTGSGSIVDVVSQIRKRYPHQESGLKYKVLLYLYVPEINVVNSAHDAGYYQANGYAALLELNAISVGSYRPLDISGQKDNFTNSVQRLLGGQDAFDAAYLYTNINESGKILDISYDLPAAVADFLFQKIVAPSMVNPTSSDHEVGEMSRLVGCENDGGTPEFDQANNVARSRKFIGFGIKRVEYPETEIEEYVTYNFAKQASLQLQYNNWQEGFGYGEVSNEEATVGLSLEVEDTKNYPKWLLSVSHLTLSQPIIETNQTKRWADLTKTWESRTQQFADDVQNEADKKSWLRLFNDECSHYFNNTFRTLGVKKFYELQRKERIAYAKYIRKHIERMLFDEWRAGERSLVSIEAFVRVLTTKCEDRIKQFRERIGLKQQEMDEANANIRDINRDWDNIGWLRDAITGASKKVLSAYKSASCDYYTAATYVEAYEYAATLLQALIEQLTQLRDNIAEYRKMLSQIQEEVDRQVGSKCRKENDSDDMNQKKYDREMVENFTKSCVINQDLQKTNAGAIRQRLVQLLGEDVERTFSALLDKADYGTTANVIIEECQSNAESAMVDAAASDSTRKMVGVNILEKIKQEYNTEEKLEAFAKSLIDSATTFLQINKSQEGISTSSFPIMLQLCIPEFEKDKEFRTKLIKVFKGASKGLLRDEKQDVCINPKQNQIVVVAARAGMPLRFISNVEVLKKKYEDLLHAPEKDLNRMVLHTESISEDLPSLFDMNTNEIRDKVKIPVLLAYALGLIQHKSDPTTQRNFDALRVKDDIDFIWKELGRDILTVTDTVARDYPLAMSLIKEVNNEMIRSARSNDQKAELRDKLREILNTAILPHPSVENNEFSPIYKEYRELVGKIFNNELKDL